MKSATILTLCALLAALSGAANAALMGHWKFDDASGTTAIDSSGSGYDADQTVAAGSWTTGKAGGAYSTPRFSLNAADSNALNLVGGSVTVSVWVTDRSGINFEGIVGFEGQGSDGDIFGFKMDNADKINWTTIGGSPQITGDTLENYAAATVDGWVHLVGVYDGTTGTSTVYVNGTSLGSVSKVGGIPDKTPPSTFNIGRYYNTTSFAFSGSVDDVQVYDTALTASDVSFLNSNPGSPLGVGVTVAMGTPAATAITDDGATLECQLFNADADDVTVVWAFADLGETTVGTWTAAPGGGSHLFGPASQDDVLSRILTGLDGDTQYSFRFLATAGGDSDWSVARSFVTGLGGSPAPADLAGTPGTTSTGTEVDLTWADSYTHETGFVIQRSTDPGFGTFDEFLVGADETSFSDDTTDPNTPYYYRIAAEGSSGTGPFSAKLEVTTGDAPATGLIAHWKFDDGSGSTAVDSSGNGNDATQTVTAGGWDLGKVGGAFDRPRFTVSDSGDYHLTGAVTVSAWVKPNAASGFTVIAGIDGYSAGSDMYALKTNSSDNLEWFVKGSTTLASTSTLSDLSTAAADGWVYVVGVFEPGVGTRLYVNGAEDASGSAAGAIELNEEAFNIGRYHNRDNVGLFNGFVDDVQLYNQALSADDVAFLFNNPGSFIGGGAASFAITEIEYAPDAVPNPTVTLTWSKTGAASYIAKVSTDLGDWETDIGDSLSAELDANPEDAEHITMTLALPPGPEFAGDLFFRIEEE